MVQLILSLCKGSLKRAVEAVIFGAVKELLCYYSWSLIGRFRLIFFIFFFFKFTKLVSLYNTEIITDIPSLVKSCLTKSSHGARGAGCHSTSDYKDLRLQDLGGGHLGLLKGLCQPSPFFCPNPTRLPAASGPLPCSALGDALGRQEEKGRESLFIWPIFKHICVTFMLALFKSEETLNLFLIQS